ncbi:unnamed protein product [Bemisia tabaci]|uniref:Uncharacterized protein n=1 Tax=Bemisia tabaci TaxID=7038 RepID=A0A9P0A815_BEMTA|nr:unnamed protein product [Bemisia tabaci]
MDAATQVFYSFGLAFGSLIAFGSYNPPKNNCVRDVILVSICNALTAIYASIVVFAILGFKAMSNVDKCIESNKHRLHFLGLIPSIDITQDEYESLIAHHQGKPDLKLEECAVCLICFLVGLIFTTGAGEYWLKMFDSFAGTIGLVMIALLEMLSVMFIYGHQKFTQDIYDMTGYRPGIYWQVTWRFLAPLIMSCILVSSIAFRFLHTPKYGAWDASTSDEFRDSPDDLDDEDNDEDDGPTMTNTIANQRIGKTFKLEIMDF